MISIKLHKLALSIIGSNISVEGMYNSRIRSISSIGECLYDNGEIEKAVEYQENAMNEYKKLFEGNNNLWRKEYSISLINLATSLEDTEEIEKAVIYSTEVVKITKEFYNIEPYDFTECYIRSLNQIIIANYKKIDISYKSGALSKENMQNGQLDFYKEIKDIYIISSRIFGETNPNTINYKEDYLYFKDEIKKH